MTHPTVGPLGRAVFGVPQSCPYCGGQLMPVFGQVVDDLGIRRPVIDPSSAQCRACWTVFPTTGKP